VRGREERCSLRNGSRAPLGSRRKIVFAGKFQLLTMVQICSRFRFVVRSGFAVKLSIRLIFWLNGKSKKFLGARVRWHGA
jgi:hypothetical protein